MKTRKASKAKSGMVMCDIPQGLEADMKIPKTADWTLASLHLFARVGRGGAIASAIALVSLGAGCAPRVEIGGQVVEAMAEAMDNTEALDAVSASCPGPFANQGQCISCATEVLNALKKSGEITGAQLGQLVSSLATNGCPPEPPAPTCTTLSTDKDARVWSRVDMVDATAPDWQEFTAMAWTWNGVPGVIRSLIEFDLSVLPANAEISSATLTLHGMGGHSSLTSSNESVLMRVTSPWLEDTVTWNNQPSTTPVNQALLPESTSAAQDYDVDVTAMVEDAMSQPPKLCGFLLRLTNETQYAMLQFASSDNPTTAHPVLTVCW